MKNKLYVGNLTSSVTEKDLEDFFSSYGDVGFTKIISDHTGASRNFGYVTMTSEYSARYCIEQTNGRPFNGSKIDVAFARDWNGGDKKPKIRRQLVRRFQNVK